MPLTKMSCFFLKEEDKDIIAYDLNDYYQPISLEDASYDSYIRIEGDGQVSANLANESLPLNLIEWELVLVGWGRQVSDYVKELTEGNTEWIELKSISENVAKIQEEEKFTCDKKLVRVVFTLTTINTNCDVFCDC
jgi:hypothetical protein